MLKFLQSVAYVQVSPERLTVRNPKSGVSVSEPPEVAIVRDPKPRILGVGTAARSTQTDSSVEIVNPFAHPRSLVSDFTVGEQLLKAFLRRLNGHSLLTLSPTVVMHPLGNPAGGFTQVEIRALHELALGAGAAQVKVWQGRALTDEELLSGEFPAGGQVLS
jgi:rod shape-determining protein MreB